MKNNKNIWRLLIFVSVLLCIYAAFAQPKNNSNSDDDEINALQPQEDLSIEQLIKINMQMLKLEKQQSNLIEKLNDLKSEKESNGDQRDKWTSDRKIRETTARLHQSIEDQNRIRILKAHIYRDGLQNEQEFLNMIDTHIAQIKKETGTDPQSNDLEKSELEALIISRQEFEWLSKHPNALKQISIDSRQNVTTQSLPPLNDENFSPDGWLPNMPLKEDDPFNAQGPGRMRAMQGRNRRGVPIAQRIERLERELQFIRNQCDRIEEELNFLVEMSELQKQRELKRNALKNPGGSKQDQ